MTKFQQIEVLSPEDIIYLKKQVKIGLIIFLIIFTVLVISLLFLWLEVLDLKFTEDLYSASIFWGSFVVSFLGMRWMYNIKLGKIKYDLAQKKKGVVVGMLIKKLHPKYDRKSSYLLFVDTESIKDNGKIIHANSTKNLLYLPRYVVGYECGKRLKEGTIIRLEYAFQSNTFLKGITI